jgi:hypothetical protein
MMVSDQQQGKRLLRVDTVEKAEFEGVTAAGADGREDIWNGAAPSGY